MDWIVPILFIFFATAAYAGARGAPWVPTRTQDVERFLSLAQIRRGQQVYDLGCGDGRVVCASARAGAQAQGFELSLFPYILAQLRRLFLPKGLRCKIVLGDFWKVNLADAEVVYFFLMPEHYQKLKAKFEQELRAGTKVVASTWPIKDWRPVKVDQEPKRVPLYLYVV